MKKKIIEMAILAILIAIPWGVATFFLWQFYNLPMPACLSPQFAPIGAGGPMEEAEKKTIKLEVGGKILSDDEYLLKKNDLISRVEKQIKGEKQKLSHKEFGEFLDIINIETKKRGHSLGAVSGTPSEIFEQILQKIK